MEQGAVIDAETSLDNMLSDLMGGVAGSAAGVSLGITLNMQCISIYIHRALYIYI